VLVDKPPGPSSFAVVRDQRRRTGARAGHAGTLDPFASGLLLVLLGASTRLARYLVGLDKRYLTDVDLSARTSTGDPEGARLDERKPPTRGELDERLAALRGDVELRVPAASAVKIAGERAYRLARRGVEVEMPVRRSTVHLLELVEYEGVVARLDLLVSTGTYVRAIADTLGGHCRTLRRTEVGPFSVDDADGERLLPPADALPFLPAVEVDAETAAAVRAGRAVDGPSPTGPVPGTRHGASGRGGAGTAAPGPDPTRPTRPWLVPGTGQGQEGRVRVVAAGELVAVARVDESVLRPETVLPA
jgi:tRNA pseudouridine55 synthase